MQSTVLRAETTGSSVDVNCHSLGFALLGHRSPIVRVHALSLLIYGGSRNIVSRSYHFDILKKSLPRFHAEVDPKTRSEYTALAKTLVTRVSAAIVQGASVAEQISDLLKQERSAHGIGKRAFRVDRRYLEEKSPEYGVAFLRWFTLFLLKELQITASYQRHVTALEILQHVLYNDLWTPSGRTTDALKSDNKDTEPHANVSQLIRPLLDLTMDPFDDVRALSASSLLCVMRSSESETVIPETLSRAKSLMQNSGRADHADGFARLCKLAWRLCQSHEDWSISNMVSIDYLLSSLKVNVEVARSNIHLAVKTAPLHGQLIALRYVP